MHRRAPVRIALLALLALAAIIACGLAPAPPAAIATGSALAVETSAAWRWPLNPTPQVLAAFRAPAGPFAAGHRGADLVAEVGQPVLAAGAGTVAFAGQVAGRGVLSVDHPGGLRTTYEPVTAAVSRGDAVVAGTVLGLVSADPGHCLPGTCLHWGLRRADTYLDPLGLLGLLDVRRVRLLPLTHPAPVSSALWGPSPSAVAPRGSAAAGPSGAPDRGPLLARG